jgi:hypothetical protein
LSSFLDTCCRILVPTRSKTISLFYKKISDLDEGVVTSEITHSFLEGSNSCFSLPS